VTFKSLREAEGKGESLRGERSHWGGAPAVRRTGEERSDGAKPLAKVVIVRGNQK